MSFVPSLNPVIAFDNVNVYENYQEFNNIEKYVLSVQETRYDPSDKSLIASL